jgi:hypothetical protein
MEGVLYSRSGLSQEAGSQIAGNRSIVLELRHNSFILWHYQLNNISIPKYTDTIIKASESMTLTRTDLKDAALLLKAGKIDLVRQILASSNDPRAIVLLDKLDARFGPRRSVAHASNDDLAEIKQLIVQKRFAEAEVLLRASRHPKAGYLLEKLAQKTSSAQASQKANAHSRQRSVLMLMSGMLSRFSQKARGVLLRNRSQA